MTRDNFLATVFEDLVGYAVVAADLEGTVLAYNEGARLIYGYAPGEVVGRMNIEAFFPRNIIEKGKMREVFGDLHQGGHHVYDGQQVRRGGEQFPVRILFALTRDEGGKTIGFVEIVQDLTVQRNFESRLDASEKRYRQLIENNIDGVITIDGAGVARLSWRLSGR